MISNVRTGSIIIAKPYRFVPPYRGTFWTALFRPFWRMVLRRAFGVTSIEIRGGQHLRESVARGHGILIASNHCRHGDPFVLGLLIEETGQPNYIMTTWHLFNQGRLLAAFLRRVGAFSVYREGPDRTALKAAAQLVAEARRPVVIFPEGMASRSNDYLRPFMDGLALMARSAARQRAASGGGVAVHPVAIRYSFEGNLDQALTPAVEEMEIYLGWTPRREVPLQERAFKLGEELLRRAEDKFMGQPHTGSAPQRIARLVEQILAPLETLWLGGRREEDSFARMKQLRGAILPGLIAGNLSEAESARRWRQLADIDTAERWYRHPPTHLVSCATPEQLLETVERIEEMLVGRARIYRPMRAVVHVGAAIEVGATGRGGGAGLLDEIRGQMQSLLNPSAATERATPAASAPRP